MNGHRYAGTYCISREDISVPRRAEAACRLAAYILRRSARQDGYDRVVSGYTVSVGQPSGFFGEDDYVIRAEALVA